MINPIFPIMLHSFEIKEFEKNKDNLIKYIYDEKEKDPVGVQATNIGGWHSKDLKKEGLLLDLLVQGIVGYFAPTNMVNKNAKMSISNIWANINGHNNLNLPHNHPRADLSGVWWIKVPPDSGNIIFNSPSFFEEFPLYEFYSDEVKNQLNFHPTYYITPGEGQVVVFPSFLTHWVEPNKSQEDRISVSFNIDLSTTPSNAK